MPTEMELLEVPLVRGADTARRMSKAARNSHAELKIPIAGFETETDKYQFARLIDAGAIQVVQPDIVQVGGITEARKIAHYAQMKHLCFTAKNYSTVVSSAACLQLLYALPKSDYFECDQDPLPLARRDRPRAVVYA